MPTRPPPCPEGSACPQGRPRVLKAALALPLQQRPEFGWFLHVPIPFVVMPAHCAAERRPLDTMRQQSHFRNRRCLAGCRRRLGRAFALKPAEEASSITLQIGGRGSRDRHPLPDRPPTLQAFRSVLSRTPSVSTQRLSRLPFVPPSPRSSIPESDNIIPKIQL